MRFSRLSHIISADGKNRNVLYLLVCWHFKRGQIYQLNKKKRLINIILTKRLITVINNELTVSVSGLFKTFGKEEQRALTLL